MNYTVTIKTLQLACVLFIQPFSDISILEVVGEKKTAADIREWLDKQDTS